MRGSLEFEVFNKEGKNITAERTWLLTSDGVLFYQSHYSPFKLLAAESDLIYLLKDK